MKEDVMTVKKPLLTSKADGEKSGNLPGTGNVLISSSKISGSTDKLKKLIEKKEAEIEKEKK